MANVGVDGKKTLRQGQKVMFSKAGPELNVERLRNRVDLSSDIP